MVQDGTMVDIGKQIQHWRNGSSEDWAVAQELISHDKIRHALFIAHLALEKTLKARLHEDWAVGATHS